ncbi:hypothetical protein ABAC460_16995 [Asticcacaulis sp. AC460]|uniref:type II toxin-antitoxin system ParD family antitoxin n=1 Tax=Asticcacaulis sp. AC460 TaxID=1282360 RepID=UPI0003C405FA|nr:type II toxin-antitoxin system ParD family antitoxin [Asticcacaulis sp. AC460]ESQ88357.1 hypothetical protein ABAC460_16995 [Asticcacaulis sp. AC460]
MLILDMEDGTMARTRDVSRDGLKNLKERKSRLEALRSHLAEGSEQARNEAFVEDYSVERIIAELDGE